MLPVMEGRGIFCEVPMTLSFRNAVHATGGPGALASLAREVICHLCLLERLGQSSADVKQKHVHFATSAPFW